MFSTSSSSATYGMPRLAVYSSTKHAVKGLTEALSVEWQRHGVRVADVLPGLIDTAILTTTTNHSGDGAAPRTAEELRATAPKKRPAAADAGQQRRRNRVAGLPPSEAAALVCAQKHSPD
ncbi:putative short chain dehydrogenase [Mycobacterium intracellulare 1956]|uniref:Putative short chain dehydrogenase n=1 Tax=Mycobacterium intracellulare 1956 TaxID=1299331 RepID=X8CSY1_MYCIT|nr:putative short chain dehydrogenase [Mycobacterium intracellulare 1956]